MRNTRTTTITLVVRVSTHKKKKMWFIFLAARSAVVLRGPVDQTKVLRKKQSCRGEEDGTKYDFCDRNSLALLILADQTPQGDFPQS